MKHVSIFRLPEKIRIIYLLMKWRKGKICEHFDFVTTKLHKLLKSVMWNMFIGCSAVEKKKTIHGAVEEVEIDIWANREFDFNNPKTWSKGLDNVEHILKVNTIPTDGLVCLFTIGQNHFERDIEKNIEKIIVKYCVKTFGR
jgi:hypothetical protein